MWRGGSTKELTDVVIVGEWVRVYDINIYGRGGQRKSFFTCHQPLLLCGNGTPLHSRILHPPLATPLHAARPPATPVTSDARDTTRPWIEARASYRATAASQERVRARG